MDKVLGKKLTFYSLFYHFFTEHNDKVMKEHSSIMKRQC